MPERTEVPVLVLDPSKTKLPAGYELADNVLRRPKGGERIMLMDGTIHTCDGDGPTPCVIVRKAWEWPAHVGYRFMAKDPEDRFVLLSEERPCAANGICTAEWRTRGPLAWLTFAQAKKLGITPPPGPWQDSLRENPHWKGEQSK